jgi:subtilase family serine protease
MKQYWGPMFKSVRFLVLVLAMILMVSTNVPHIGAEAWAQLSVVPGNSSPAIATLVGPSAAPPDQVLSMRIVMSPGNLSELETLLAGQQDPSSPQYHQWLKRGEFDSRFGPPATVRTAISSWLKRQGFTIMGKQTDAFALSFQGTVQQAEKAFSVSIKSSNDGKHYANVNSPSLPSQFAKATTSVEGLDNLGGGRSTMHVRLGSGTPKTLLAQTTDSIAAGRGSAPHVLESVFYNGLIAFGPGDFYSFYDEMPLLSQGVNGSGGGCIGLIEIGDYDSQGLTNFDEIFDLPTPVITRVISPHSDNPGINSRSDETMLDLLYAHAIAPGAPINVYLTDFNASPYNGNVITSTIDSLNTAVDQDTCSALSISIESCGFPASFYTGALHTTYMKAASQGQTVFVAEGDEGAAEFQPSSTGQGCVTGTSQHVNELASDPFVTSIGGTQFEPNYDTEGNDVGYVPESVWNEPQYTSQGIGAGGGGRSVVFQKPSFQQLGTPHDGSRDVPDISMEAACATPGVFSVFPYQSTSGDNVTCCACGTSLGAPVWAGITELLVQKNDHQRVGTLNPRLYALGNEQDTVATGIRDVTNGNNSFNGVAGFSAVPGYDLASGWGTPDIDTFVEAYLKPECVPLGESCTSNASCCAGSSPGGNVCEEGVCTPYRPPGSCNGFPKPPTGCSAQWHCCGTDGWTCRLCR